MNLDVTCILLLLNTLNKKVSQIDFFSVCLHTVFLSSELISWDESSRLLDDISDMFFIAPSLANLSDISFVRYIPVLHSRVAGNDHFQSKVQTFHCRRRTVWRLLCVPGTTRRGYWPVHVPESSPFGSQCLDRHLHVFPTRNITLAGAATSIIFVAIKFFLKFSDRARCLLLPLAGTAKSIILVRTKVLCSRQKYACRDKNILLRQNVCHDKYLWHVFVATKICLSQQNYVCRDKHVFLATKRLRDKYLSQQTYFCRDKRVS